MMIQRDLIKEGMVVRTSDGEKLGKVDACSADGFLIRKGIFFPEDYSARFDQVSEVRDGEVWLSTTSTLLGKPNEGYRKEGEYDRTLVGDREDRHISLHSEELAVDKRVRDSGEVTLRKDVITERKEVTVPVMHEKVTVERVPVTGDRAALSGDEAFKEKTISVPLREEEVEVRKRPVVREEVRVSRAPVVEERRVGADLRREELDVDKKGEVEEVDREHVKGGYRDPDKF